MPFGHVTVGAANNSPVPQAAQPHTQDPPGQTTRPSFPSRAVMHGGKLWGLLQGGAAAGAELCGAARTCCGPTTPPPVQAHALSAPGRSRGAILSQYYNRTARLRRRSSRPPLLQTSRAARPSLRQYDLELDAGHAQEEGEFWPLVLGRGWGAASWHCSLILPLLVSPEKRCLLVKELQSLPSSQRSHLLLTMPLSLAQKRSLRWVPAMVGVPSAWEGGEGAHAGGRGKQDRKRAVPQVPRGAGLGLSPVPLQPTLGWAEQGLDVCLSVCIAGRTRAGRETP